MLLTVHQEHTGMMPLKIALKMKMLEQLFILFKHQKSFYKKSYIKIRCNKCTDNMWIRLLINKLIYITKFIIRKSDDLPDNFYKD